MMKKRVDLEQDFGGGGYMWKSGENIHMTIIGQDKAKTKTK